MTQIGGESHRKSGPRGVSSHPHSLNHPSETSVSPKLEICCLDTDTWMSGVKLR